MKGLFRSLPKGGMGFPAVCTGVGRGHKRPDVRILSLLCSSSPSFSLLCCLQALPMLVVNTGQNRLWERSRSGRQKAFPGEDDASASHAPSSAHASSCVLCSEKGIQACPVLHEHLSSCCLTGSQSPDDTVLTAGSISHGSVEPSLGCS